jgi:hypothetical protein
VNVVGATDEKRLVEDQIILGPLFYYLIRCLAIADQKRARDPW